MAKNKDYESRTEELVLPVLEPLGLELYDVEYVKEGSEYFLRVYVDKPGGVTIDDCVSVSRVFNEILDREDYIGDPYTFEVSSPGLGRKLTRDRHFEKSIGEEIQIKFYKEQDGMKECTGILEDFDKDTITIRTDQDMRKYNRKDIASVRCTFDFDE